MKKVLLLIGVICFTSIVLTGCGGKITGNKENSTAKAEKPQQIKKEVIIDDSPNPPYWKRVIIHDIDGKITEETHFNNGNILNSRQQYTYNNLGDKIEWSIYNSNKELSQQTTYFYDKSRKLVKEIQKMFDGTQSESTYTYNTDGKVIRGDFANSFTYRHEFVYDNAKNLKSQIYYNTDDTKDIENFVFDEYGNKIEVIDGNSHVYNKYDKKNNLTEELHSYRGGDGGTKFTMKYTYNIQGDWIERKTYISEVKTELGKLRGTETREITYFP